MISNVKKQPIWNMVNVHAGFIIYEDCPQTKQTRSFFTKEAIEVVDEYTENGFIWKYAASAQSIQFDLQHIQTNEVVSFQELLGIMLCTGCNQECPLYDLEFLGTNQNIWIYVALTYQSPEGKIPLTREKLQVLNEYFNNKLVTPEKKILILPDHIILPPQKCFGEIIVDQGMTEMNKTEP